MQVKEPITKRKILSAIKSAYNFLGLASPISVTAKIIFSEICLRHLGWDHLIPEDTEKMECMGKDLFGKEFFNCSTLRHNSRLSASLLKWIR